VNRHELSAWVRRHLGLLATLVALTPFAIAAVGHVVRVEATHWRWGDLALIELSTHDVGSHAVLLGPYSRFGWHHPGPTLFYLLALPYRLLGGHPVGLSIGGAAIGALTTAAIAWVAYRRGGRPLLLWTLVVVSLFARAAGSLVTDFWNPFAPILPLALVVLLAWSVACRDMWALPALIGVGSFVVQSHVGFLPTVLVVTGGGIGLGTLSLLRLRGTDEWDAQKRRAVAAGAVALSVGAALWVLPVVQQFVDEPGNFGRLGLYWREADPNHSVRQSLEMASAELGVIADEFVGGEDRPGVASGGTWHWTAALSAAALLAAAGVAASRRWWDLVALAGLTSAAWLVAVYSLNRIVGPMLPYLTAWVAVLGVPLWIAVGACVVRVPAGPRGTAPAWVRTSALVLALAAIVGLAAPYADDLSGDVRRTRRTALVEDTLVATETAVDRADCGPIRVRVGSGSKWLAWAVVLWLERNGADFGVERSRITELHLNDWYLVEPVDEGTVLVTDRPNDGDQLDARLDVAEYPCAGADENAGQ
jgi:hypothetical protein